MPPDDAEYQRQYYLRTRELKGRQEGIKTVSPKRASENALKLLQKGSSNPKSLTPKQRKIAVESAKKKSHRLEESISKLNKALKETHELLRNAKKKEQKGRESRKKEERKNSDGKTTAKERLASKKSRNKQKANGGSSQSKKSAKKKPADMNVEELEDRVKEIKETIGDAKAQLSSTKAKVKALTHSELNDDSDDASSFGVAHSSNQPGKEKFKMTVAMEDRDFGGWATVANRKCADGLTISQDAFADQHGTPVPLVYQHNHNDPTNVLGHAILESKNGSMYAHCFFNESDKAQHSKILVEHGDITMLSIYANRLLKEGDYVKHGKIREVSLVMAGANPEAVIDFVAVRHSDGFVDEYSDEAIIFTGEELEHADKKDDKKVANEDDDSDDSDSDDSDDAQAIFDSLTDKQKDFVDQLLGATAAAAAKHSDDDSDDSNNDDSNDDSDDSDNDNSDDSDDSDNSDDADNSDKTDNVDDTQNTDDSDEENSNSDDNESSDAEDSAQHDDITHDQEGSEMTHNVFDKTADKNDNKDEGYTLKHGDMEEILEAAETSTMKKAVQDFALKHGIEQIDVLFPDARSVTAAPEWLARRSEWVGKVLGATRHTPFSKIKSLSADLTLPQARAKGYIKGTLKEEEFFEVSTRTTTPTTVYKKQALDRDDILDITDFDVVAWLKGEMRLMLDEELARAILMGDGRSNGDPDKIKTGHIRPIATDSELFQTTVFVNVNAENSSSEAIVDSLLLQRMYYRGSGNPTFFTNELVLAQILNVKDGMGRRIYQNISDLAATLRVRDIVPVEVMQEDPTLLGILVNLQDYTVGADRGGDVNLFDGFDIDYNKQKYLIETRCSGALTKAKSAIVVRRAPDSSTLVTPLAPEWDADQHGFYIPSISGLKYRNQDTSAELANGVLIPVTPGQPYKVVATLTNPNQYHLSSTSVDQFTFTYEDGLVEGPY